jgi:hypothetical protein
MWHTSSASPNLDDSSTALTMKFLEYVIKFTILQKEKNIS